MPGHYIRMLFVLPPPYWQQIALQQGFLLSIVEPFDGWLATRIGDDFPFGAAQLQGMRARNAHFNLNRLGVVVREYAANFYGTDYSTNPAEQGSASGMDSDRLFASWELNDQRVESFSQRQDFPLGEPERAIEIPADFGALLKSDPDAAKREVLRVRQEFVQTLMKKKKRNSFIFLFGSIKYFIATRQKSTQANNSG